MDFNKILESFAEIPAKVEEAKEPKEDEMDDNVQEEERERSSSAQDYDRSVERDAGYR